MKFGVAEHDVAVVTAVTTLMSVADIIREVGVSLGNEKINVSIHAPEPGSVNFDILIQVVAAQLHQILPVVKDSIDVGKSFLELLKISKDTNGERPRSVSLEVKNGKKVTQIVGQKGNTYIFQGDIRISANLLRTNAAVQKNIKTLGEAGKRDGDLNSLSFKHNDDELEIAREVFNALEQIGEDLDAQEIIDDDARLVIIRPSFDAKLKSDFYYKGSRITCSIHDAEFYKEIDGGKKFSKGDILVSRLIIKQKLDPSVNAFVNNSYIVQKVMKHIPRSEQPSLGFG